MRSKLLRADILAICCVDDVTLVGMGYMLYIFKKCSELLGKLNCLYPNNIHGVVDGPNNNVAVFGAKSLAIYTKEEIKAIKSSSKVCQFNDWIITVQWLSMEDHSKIIILFAHNNVSIYDVINGDQQNVQCEEKCILYGGSISGCSMKDLVIFSGTVFQEILIWKIPCNSQHYKNAPVLQRLLGHNGIIFSVIYDPHTQYICSTSDDRTVRLWKVAEYTESVKSNIDWGKVNVTLEKTMFGHTARVWRAIMKEQRIVTIGEDSLLCMWTFGGELIEKVCAHHGAAIWSIAISDNGETILTGGADGAVHAWPFKWSDTPSVVPLYKINKHHTPKHICHLNSGTIVVFNEGGILMCYDNGKDAPRETLFLERYNTYCIMQVSPCHSYVAFASRVGYITIYAEYSDTHGRKLSAVYENKILECQIFSLQWLDSDRILLCGTHGVLKVVSNITKGATSMDLECILPVSRERWVTAAIIYNDLLVCGDRSGNIHTFNMYKSRNGEKLKDQTTGPIQTLAKVHGRIGAQSCAIINKKLITTGRDGLIKFYEVQESASGKTLRVLYKKKMPMDWISGTLQICDDMLVLGFKEVDFIIYSLVYHRILQKIHCGGGHRSWDCILLNKAIHFAYIRNKQAYIFNYQLPSLSSPVVQLGFHTKEVYCMKQIGMSANTNTFISGGEDCTLRVCSISNTELQTNNFRFETLGTFDGHLSSIRSIAIVNLEATAASSKHLVFSGGGRAQLRIWEIKVDHGQGPSSSDDVSHTDLKSYMLFGSDQYRKKPWQEAQERYHMDPDTRFMDIDYYYPPQNKNYVFLFVACADGYLRTFVYNIIANSIYLAHSINCANRCILRLYAMTWNKNVLVLTMTTDGIVRAFDFTNIVICILDKSGQEYHSFINHSMNPFWELKIHQSGINTFDIRKVRANQYLLASGGDDNLLSVTLLKIELIEGQKVPIITMLSKWSDAFIHAAQITGIKFCSENKIFSVGMDQELITHTYKLSNGILSVESINKLSTCVADVQGMLLCFPKGDETLACVYGNGFEVISV